LLLRAHSLLRSSILETAIIDEISSVASNILKNNGGPDAAPAKKLAVLRIHGPDQKGIVSAFAQLLYGHGCNLASSEQHTDASLNFFQRICFDYSTMHTDRQSIATGVKDVCDRFGMTSGKFGWLSEWFKNVCQQDSNKKQFIYIILFSLPDLNWGDRKKRVAIMVSKYDHCLWEILLRRRNGDIDCDISVIISNHPDLQHVAETFGIPFEVFKITKANKDEQEAKELDILQNKYDVDLVILARYMQIISDNFCNTFKHKVINIHHSFLPAFIGECVHARF
jgi:formyltetrahydrofolate deformylase